MAKRQKQKQSQKQSIVVNIKLDKPKRAKRRRARAPAQPQAEQRQLPPVAYIISNAPQTYWSESQARKPEELPLSTGVMKPIVLGETVKAEKPVKEVIPTKKEVLSAFIEPVKTTTLVEDAKDPAEDISTLINREKVILEKKLKKIQQEKPPKFVSSEEPLPATAEAPYMKKAEKAKEQEVPVSRLSKVQLLEKLATEQNMEREFLRGMSKKEMVMLYKQGKSVAKQSSEISDIGKTFSILEFPRKPQGIMDVKPAQKPFWSMAVGEENIPEL